MNARTHREAAPPRAGLTYPHDGMVAPAGKMGGTL